MRLSAAQREALAKWAERPGLTPYGTEYRTVQSLCLKGLMENAGGNAGGFVRLTDRGRAVLNAPPNPA